MEAHRPLTRALRSKREEQEELKARLDQLVDDAEVETDDGLASETVRRFKAGGPELLDQATEHMWAYYRSVAAGFDRDQRASHGIPDIARPDDVWHFVEIENAPSISEGDGKYAPAASYISFEGEVAWEPEHGLQLVFEDGARVCKVGPYDGHLTNAHAYADLSLLGVIFTE